jgi:hypothetical protein
VRVIAIANHTPLPLHHAIERAREPHAEPLHRPPQRARIRRLDDEVHVIAHDGVVHEPEAEA